MQPQLNPAERILRLPEVKARTGLSRSSIYAYIKDGKFPHHISLGERSIGWFESEVDAWVVSRQRVNRNAQ
jgi:prophage regulatory protein